MTRPAPILALCALAAGCVPATEAPDPDGIPAAMQGRWALSPADCEGGADAEGLMRVDATTLRFYETRATLTSPAERTETHLRGTFAFEGEGDVWTREEALDLREGGTRLVRREFDPDAPAVAVIYAACP